MVSIYELHGWSDVVPWLGWTLVVLATGKALFRSFLLEELRTRWKQKQFAKQQEASKRSWEIKENRRWTAESARGEAQATHIPLTPQRKDENIAWLRKAFETTLRFRILNYFLSCIACQSFWAALGIFLCTRSVEVWWPDAFLSALAYSATASLAARPSSRSALPLSPEEQRRQQPPARQPGGCLHGDC